MALRPNLACCLFYHPLAANGFRILPWFKNTHKHDKDNMWLTHLKYLLFGPLQESLPTLTNPDIKAESHPFRAGLGGHCVGLGCPPFSLMAGLWFSRTNSSERPGNQGPKTEDSRSHGRHAQHNVQCRHQPPEPGVPPLLFQICGDQPLGTRSQRLCLPAHEEVKASCVSPSSSVTRRHCKGASLAVKITKVYIVFCGTAYVVIFKKGGKRTSTSD